MVTLAQLKRENARLKARAESREEIKQIGRERAKLQKENRDLKNPKTTAFKKMLRRGVMSGGRGALKLLDDLTRPVPVKRRKVKKKVKRNSTKRRRR